MLSDKKRKFSSATNEIVQYINVDNAKLIAFLIVIACVVFHGTLHAGYGGDSCHWLLTRGRFQGNHIWQPFGCMIHRYTSNEAKNCLRYIAYWGGRNNIAFVGDSRLRGQYHAFHDIVSGDVTPNDDKVHANLNYQDDSMRVKLDFVWAPILDKNMTAWVKNRIQGHSKPDMAASLPLVIIGSGLWTMKYFNGSMDGLEVFKANLTRLAPLLSKLANRTKVLWVLQEDVDEKVCHEMSRDFLSNAQVTAYNKATREILRGSGVELWESARLVSEGYDHWTKDGLHLTDPVLQWDSQMLMNMYCNDHMNFDDGTCCSSAEPITVLQIITASLALSSLLIATCMYTWRRWRKPPSQRTNHKHSSTTEPLLANTNNTATADTSMDQRAVSAMGTMGTRSDKVSGKPSNSEGSVYELMVSLARLGVIMIYFFLCDRTNFFMKENKYYTHVNFFLPFSYLMIVGIFFTETSKYTDVLHRDQTDEWKGWMQLVILIYHLTGASKVLMIYMQIRVLVSSYLFLTGFGHFYYFFTKGDYSLHRFFVVLFRFNFLVILLCFTMNRPYQFYYFVPLVSFTFLLTYLLMAVWPRVNKASCDARPLHYFYLVLKIALLVTVITLLYMSEVLFEDIFLSQPLKPLFTSADDSIYEWRFRWKIDRYSAVFGMVFALALLVSKKQKLFDDSRADQLFTRGMSWLLSALALAGITGYFIFASFCRSKTECNEIHTYISFVPIVSFIFLRNISGWLRTKYSSFFAWFGRISLELFIAQYHIWLASDTHGVLVLVPNYPVLNLTVTSIVFICAAHEIHSITTILLPYCVPNDWKLLLRNTMVFLFVMLPVAIHRGVFA